jgi:hypothetical protein
MGQIGGVNVYRRWILGEESWRKALRVVAELLLFVLVTGLWARLWVPPLGR